VTKTIVVGQKPPPPATDPSAPEDPAAPAPTQTFDISGPTDGTGTTSQPAPLEQPAAPAQPAAAVAPLRWLSPFPTVRMRGRTTRKGVQLSTLTARGPYGAIAEVRCKGRGCPDKVSRTKLKTKSKKGSATVHFKRFERFLPGGVELQVSVSKKGMVGKYTRIKIRKLALPVRTDRCLLPGKSKPAACPATP
jgi:hypothetical protein